MWGGGRKRGKNEMIINEIEIILMLGPKSTTYFHFKLQSCLLCVCVNEVRSNENKYYLIKNSKKRNKGSYKVIIYALKF